MREHVLVRNVEGGVPDVPLEMQVVPVGGDVLVVYATLDSILQIVGRPERGGFKFSRPQRVYKLRRPALDLRLASSSNRLHLLWTQPGLVDTCRRLLYATADGPDAGWSVPKPISATALPETANLLADRSEVFAAWADSRFGPDGSGEPAAGKVMVAASRDEGVTFSEPVMISDPDDAEDTAAQLLVTKSGQDLVAYSSPQPGPDWPGRWRRVTADRSLEHVTPGGELTGEELLAAYGKRMAGVLEGRSEAESRTAQAE
jgi:hypothetical protein